MNTLSVTSENPSTGTALDQLCINTMRFLAVDAVQKANSGHPGLPLGASPMAYTLWTQFLKHNPSNPNWFNRDRFVLSAGHGSMLLYSLLYLTGYAVSLEDIQRFRQLDSITPGHPERHETPGVEITTGPLGQGFANGVGMAIAEAHLAAVYNRPGHDVIHHYTYALVSDGDLMEGVSSEAASLAGHLKLGKLIYLYDDNGISLAGTTNLTFTEDCAKRFEAYGWHTQFVEDGNDIVNIHQAIQRAQAETNRPSLIMVKTIIGYGSPNKEGSFEAHGSPLGENEVKLTKENLNWPVEPAFLVPEDALTHFRAAVDAGKKSEADWQSQLDAYREAFPALAASLEQRMKNEFPKDWVKEIPSFPADPKGIATRKASSKVLNALAAKMPALFGGSADLNPSTFTAMDGFGDFQNIDSAPGKREGVVTGEWGYGGRNFAFGVREHAMGSIQNGLAAHGGFIPYSSTFLTFSDYMRPPIRLASLMSLQTLYVFTHDSIGLGEDGPTHQPVEQVASLRAIPNLIVIRPCDANETAYAWQAALSRPNHPTAFILSRQNLPTLDRTQYASAEGVLKGAYVLYETAGKEAAIILIATGSEVKLALDAAKQLEEKGVAVRVVSMPSWELFDEQPQEYREHVFPASIPRRVVIEAGICQGWHRYLGQHGAYVTMDSFGSSAPAEALMKKYGFTVDNIVSKAQGLLSQSFS